VSNLALLGLSCKYPLSPSAASFWSWGLCMNDGAVEMMKAGSRNMSFHVFFSIFEPFKSFRDSLCYSSESTSILSVPCLVIHKYSHFPFLIRTADATLEINFISITSFTILPLQNMGQQGLIPLQGQSNVVHAIRLGFKVSEYPTPPTKHHPIGSELKSGLTCLTDMGWTALWI
jgi:hypothetical protein